MRTLFDLDQKNYDECKHTYIRNSARSIIIKNGLIAMVHSIKYDYYKFPGGGIENGESETDALIRETLEEAGLTIIKDTIKEYGMVHRIQKSLDDETECFIQDNFYYICDTEEDISSQKLDDYESKERFTFEYVKPEVAIATNRKSGHGPKDPVMIEREAKVLEMLIEEGYFK